MKSHSRSLIKVLSVLDSIDKGVEVGVWNGQNAFHLLKKFEDLHLVLVDDYDAKKLEMNNMPSEEVEWAQRKCTETLKKFTDRYNWMQMESLDASEYIVDGSQDFVFLDANHWYKSVKADIDAWLPKVRIEGILAGHDFSGHFRGIQRAVLEKFGEEEFSVENKSRIWWVVV